MLLIEKQNFTLASDRRLVKAADVATAKSAAEIVADAEAEARRIRDKAKAAFEEERKRGYEKGLQDGKLEIAMQKLEQVDQSVAFMESVEGKMADIVMKALRSFVVEVGDKEMVVNIVSSRSTWWRTSGSRGRRASSRPRPASPTPRWKASSLRLSVR